MRGDQKIIRADRLSRGLQLDADVRVFSIGGNIEREDGQRIEDGLDTRKEPRRTALGGGEPQFGGGDDADRQAMIPDRPQVRRGPSLGISTRSETIFVSSM